MMNWISLQLVPFWNKFKLKATEKLKEEKEYYNLDMIISIGFRVNSKKVIKFRSIEESSCRI